MSRKPEATFRDSVHRHMKNVAVHRQPVGNIAHAGTPDFYYESNKTCLWVEWKFWKVVPPMFNLVQPTMKSHKTKLSTLQREWLDRAHSNGVNAMVICGCPDGGAIFTVDEMHYSWTRDCFMSMLKTRKELAAWIEAYVWAEFYECDGPRSRRRT